MKGLEKFTYEFLLDTALDNVSDGIDKREGAIIYDTIAPSAYLLSLYFMEVQKVVEQTFATTATGEYLDNRVAEQGVKREKETYALKKGTFLDDKGKPKFIPLGSRFSTIDNDIQVNYYVESVYTDKGGLTVPGSYKLRSETPGVVGNNYVGDLLPISYIQDLASATMTDVIEPAQDEESDESLRERFFKKINNRAFGGNIAQYDQGVREYDGVGDLQVYPTWKGGGTVLLSVVDAEYNPISEDFQKTLKEKIDPENASGQGIGMAPIGHKVTIVTPKKKEITITADVTLDTGVMVSQVQPEINEKLEELFLNLRKLWGVGDDLNNYTVNVYVAKVMTTILMVGGVANVQNVKLNGSDKDLIIPQTPTSHDLPYIKEVKLNAVK